MVHKSTKSLFEFGWEGSELGWALGGHCTVQSLRAAGAVGMLQ